MTVGPEADRGGEPGSEPGVDDTFKIAFRNTSLFPSQLSPFLGRGQIRICRDAIRVVGKRTVQPKFSILRVIGVLVTIPMVLLWPCWFWLLPWLFVCMVVGSLAKYGRTVEGTVEYRAGSGVRVGMKGRVIWIEGSHYKMRLAQKNDIALVAELLSIFQDTGAARPMMDMEDCTDQPPPPAL